MTNIKQFTFSVKVFETQQPRQANTHVEDYFNLLADKNSASLIKTHSQSHQLAKWLINRSFSCRLQSSRVLSSILSHPNFSKAAKTSQDKIIQFIQRKGSDSESLILFSGPVKIFWINEVAIKRVDDEKAKRRKTIKKVSIVDLIKSYRSTSGFKSLPKWN